jgi:hypothetical protein
MRHFRMPANRLAHRARRGFIGATNTPIGSKLVHSVMN